MLINFFIYRSRYNLFMIIFFISFLSFSQNETDHWYFGKNGGIDFGNGEVEVLEDSSMVTPAGCSSISDDDGNLMFYTNGQTVWNKNHQIMTNGEGLSGEIDGIQSAIIVPKPNDNSTYYIFYTRENVQISPIYFLSGIYYSEVKFNTQNPLGFLTENKDIRIAEVASTSRIAAIHHSESNAIRVVCITKPDPVFGYIIQEGEFIYRIFNVTVSGVDLTPVKRVINESLGKLGAMKIAPDASFLAFADSVNQKVYFYEYDNDSINFQLYYILPTIPAFGVFLNPYGIEFSQDSKIFYYTGGNYIVQFAYRELGGMEPVDYFLIPISNPGSIQLARNGKIYVAQGDMVSPTSHIGVINNPEMKGSECNYSPAHIQFENASSTKGLPLFVASYLRSRIIPSKDNCVDVAFSFELDAYRVILSVLWDFGDGTTSSDFNPTHLFSTPGKHKVKARIVMDNNQAVTLYKDVVAYPLPDLPPNQTLSQCDTDGDNISVFNLENIKDFTDDIDSDYTYTFYHNLSDANSDTNQIQDYLHYTNQTNPEEIFVKIVSSNGCVTITNFFIENYQANTLPIRTMYVCENSDAIENNSQGQFNIGFKETDIRDELGIPADFTITFYANLVDAQTKINPLERYFISPTTIIWVRIEDESNNCFGVIPFNAVVNSNINLNIDSNYTICDPSMQPPIILDGGNGMTSWLWGNQGGNILSTQRFYQPIQQGDYSITVTKLENGLICSASKPFSVTKVTIPEFVNIKANDGEVSLTVSGNSVYEFSLDGSNYYGSGNSYNFIGVGAGIHTVYVKDINNCEKIITTEVYLMNIPKFFSPNEDGINDHWKIKGLSRKFYSSAEILIFDRYGTILHKMDMQQNQFGWSGVKNDRKLPATDYWYTLTLVDLQGKQTIKKGHFSLIR
ncbi:T9SS type B sorting domain-containing protein [Flavobacterium dankookense]|uniref:Gliding motility-associated-like protein n=1 Tax=Flavobacterium dankookense TaxID=706186 RepID=A0A4R6Q7T4_9FLAO|nr:T9SS type B sorting domain-containing protein [Flavobacterium dankookense]TDP57876.1 gliding motility-associated-like protein [Flavobacterium dankookense]